MNRAHCAFATAAIATALASAASGCGGGGDTGGPAVFASHPAPPASEFPSAQGRSLADLMREVKAGNDVVAAPTSSVFGVGANRFGFGVFTVSRQEIPDAKVALYAAPQAGGALEGPFPARTESLVVAPQYRSLTTSEDPDAAHVVYVSDVRFTRPGAWNLVALIDRGSGMEATAMPTVQVGSDAGIPQVGQVPPRIHTLTVADVHGDVARIDTRKPPDDMHSADFANVLGRKPIVLLFATPALCQSRVCGPVVDVAEEVKHEPESKGVVFIHQEVYRRNDASQGLRPQLRAFHLRTEPWLFVINRQGRITTRIEGAFGTGELEQAVRAVAPGGGS